MIEKAKKTTFRADKRLLRKRGVRKEAETNERQTGSGRGTERDRQ